MNNAAAAAMAAAPAGTAPAADRLQAETDLHSLKQRSVRGAVATFTAQGLRFGLQFGSQIALARLLLPADFGLVAMIAPVLSFVQIFNELGLSQATIQRPHISQGQLTALFWINGGIGLVMALAMIAMSPLVAYFYGEPRLTAACMCIGTLLLVSGLSTQQIALMNRRMQFTSLAVIDVACAAVAVVAGVAGALAGMGYWALILMQAANSLTILILSWVLSDWRPSRPRREAGVGAMLRFGGHLTSYNLINFAGTNCDSVLIGKLSGSVALGLYDRAFKLVAAPIWQVSLPVDRVATSLLSRLHDSPGRYRDAFGRMLQILLLITVPAVVCVAMAAHTLVPLLLGHAWVAASPIVAALAVATSFAPLSIASYWLFVSQDRAGEQLRYVALKTGIALIALLAGIHWGSLGVAPVLCRVWSAGSRIHAVGRDPQGTGRAQDGHSRLLSGRDRRRRRRRRVVDLRAAGPRRRDAGFGQGWGGDDAVLCRLRRGPYVLAGWHAHPVGDVAASFRSRSRAGRGVSDLDERSDGAFCDDPVDTLVPPSPRFAVVFKTYSWDPFIERQARRLAVATGPGDFYISMDETNATLPETGFARIERISNAALIASGLADRAERGSLIWWNADYPHYTFFERHDDYDFYIFIEYDALIQTPIAELVSQIAASGADFVAGTLDTPIEEWFWARYHQQVYPIEELRGSINCIAIFSNRALSWLRRRRLEMSADPSIRYWPSSEAFVPTEIRRAGFTFQPLAAFGDVSHYDWFPPTLEDDLPDCAGKTFVHPLLNDTRYISTTLRANISPLSLILPYSAVRKQLRRFPRADYMSLLPQAVWRRLRDVIAERCERLWFRVTDLATARRRGRDQRSRSER